MIFDPLQVPTESGRLGHLFYGGSHVRGCRLMTGMGICFEGADDLAHLLGFQVAGEEGEEGVVVLLGNTAWIAGVQLSEHLLKNSG
jgi:hypothetical protein